MSRAIHECICCNTWNLKGRYFKKQLINCTIGVVRKGDGSEERNGPNEGDNLLGPSKGGHLVGVEGVTDCEVALHGEGYYHQYR